MKKTLVALATLSAIGSAFADVDVSGGIKLYGVLDQAATKQTLTNPTSTTGSTQSYTSMFASQATSRLGFKGTRDLGDGIKGRIQAEIQAEPDNSTLLPTKNRGTFVALSKEGAGEILFGTQETTAYEIFAMDVNGRVEYKPQVWRTVASDNLQDRANNSLKYISPEFGGLTFHYMKSLSDKVSTSSQLFTSYGVKYHVNNFRVALVADKLTNTVASYKFAGIINAGPANEGYSASTPAAFNQMNTAYNYAGSTSNSVLRQFISASYDFGDFYLNYIYAKSYANEYRAGSNVNNTIGIRVPFDKASFAISYGTGNVDSYSSSHSAPTVTTSSAGTNGVTTDASINDITFGFDYNIDKATKVYFLASKSGFAGGGLQNGSNITTAIGARYNF